MLESNLMIMLSAHAFASFGFGLSVLAMWFRWLASTAVFRASLVSLGKFSDTGHCCDTSPSPSSVATSRAAIHITSLSTPLQTDSMSAPSGVTPIQRRFRRLTLPHTGQPIPIHPSTTLSDLNSVGSESLDSTPTESESLSLPATPMSVSNLPLDPPEHEKVPRRRSNSTSSLLLKVKLPFRARDKRFSLPVVLPEQAPPLLPMNKTTRMAMAVSTLKTKRAKTLWHLSRDSSSASTTGSDCSHDSKPSRRKFLSFHRRSNPAPHSDARSTRKTSHPVKLPRTLPYEAPYFANPPVSSQESQFRSLERNCSECS
ncbi:hypothetical protein Agabi119p4_332 [Agaricus bisporus var. burnettii]|uniref:Uncharacterized protein n=1 Tax=Agaricus bisporus var. burnettii TaxID=192524 RepID=A0A8H7KKZ2_AGABI|nr:hypothetical protein Agabi119p4_332 [Agaricus bisporus var. burnettii]